MKLQKIVRDESYIEITREIEGQKANDVEKRTTHEAPLKAFDKALQALSTTVCFVLGTGQEWGNEVTVKSLAISYTKKGTRSASIGFTRALTCTEKEHSMSTPFVQFDEPAEGEQDSREVHKKHADAIEEMLEQAEKYANGERSQMLLGIDKEKPKASKPEDPNQEKLPGV